MTQNKAITEQIYKNMETIARFVETTATKEEVVAILEAINPLNKAINSRLGVENAPEIDIEQFLKKEVVA